MGREKTGNLNKFGAFKRALIARSDLANKHNNFKQLLDSEDRLEIRNIMKLAMKDKSLFQQFMNLQY